MSRSTLAFSECPAARLWKQKEAMRTSARDRSRRPALNTEGSLFIIIPKIRPCLQELVSVAACSVNLEEQRDKEWLISI